MENKNSERQKIAARLKEARELSGLSQTEAANKLKLQRPAISEIEGGKRKVTAEEIIQFAKLYKVDASWLILQEKENETSMHPQLKFAARELGKMKKDDIQKLLHVLKMLPK